MCNLFKNTLNDTPFFRKLHMQERNRGRLNTGVWILGACSALSLSALSSPTHGAVLGCPQKPLCHASLFHIQLGTLSPSCCWGTHQHVLSPFQVGRVPGGWGQKVSHHHHHLHRCTTLTAEGWPLILSTTLCLVMSSSPSFWDGRHATVCCSPLVLLWKYQFPFVAQLPQSG